MMPFDLNAIAQLSATRLVDCLVEGTLIAAVVGLALKARRQDSRTTFAIWFASLLGIAALPLIESFSSGRASASVASRSVLTLPESWALCFFYIWAAVVLCALARVGFGLWHLRQLRESCAPVDLSEVDASVRNTLESRRGSRTATLCVSNKVQVPTAIGLFKPAIVIPRWTLEELSSAELNQILLHELAHLRRWDDWTNLAQQIVKAVFFFHPAVWWIERKISLEREMACDDAVVSETASPRVYAECLANLAEKTFVQRSIALAQAALGRIRHTSHRVARLLDASRPVGRKHAWQVAVTVVAVFVGGCVIAASRAPKLITFTNGVPANTIAASRIDSGVSHVPVPVTPVTLRPSATMTHASTPRRAKPAGQVAHRMNEPNRALIAQVQPPPIEQILHLAKLTPAPLMPVQTIFVMYESRDVSASGVTMYEIRVWRLTVWHPVVDPEKQIPRKQI